MHRETNLQVENEETIEAQSARTQSAVGRNPTALFHLVREFPSMVQVSGAAFLAPAFCIASSASRAVPPVFAHSCQSIATGAAACMLFGLTRLACAKRVR